MTQEQKNEMDELDELEKEILKATEELELSGETLQEPQKDESEEISLEEVPEEISLEEEDTPDEKTDVSDPVQAETPAPIEESPEKQKEPEEPVAEAKDTPPQTEELDLPDELELDESEPVHEGQVAEEDKKDADSNELDYFLSKEYKEEKIAEIFQLTVTTKEGEIIPLSDILNQEDVWFTQDRGKPIVHELGTEKIAKVVGASYQEELIEAPTPSNERGWYFKVTCTLANGHTSVEYGGANDYNCTSKIAKGSKINMAIKRGKQRALFAALEWHDFYSSSESDDFDRVEMMKKNYEERIQKVKSDMASQVSDAKRETEKAQMIASTYQKKYQNENHKRSNLVIYSKALIDFIESHGLVEELMKVENPIVPQYSTKLLEQKNKEEQKKE